MRARGVDIEVDLNDSGNVGLDDSGMGDMDVGFLTVPYRDMEKKVTIAVGGGVVLRHGIERRPLLWHNLPGSAAVCLVLKPFDGMFDLVTAAYRRNFGVDEDEGRGRAHQGLIDVFLLKASAYKQCWVLIDP